jgi:hypothetical protein
MRHIIGFLLLLTASLTYAETRRPWMELGGALEVDGAGEANVLLRVGVQGTNTGATVSWFAVYAARVRGDVGLNFHGGTDPVPYLDIDFTPVFIGYVDEDLDAVMPGASLGFNLGHTHVTRNISLGNEVGLVVDAIGFSYPFLANLSDNGVRTDFFATIVADAVGYKLASFTGDRPEAHGFNLVSAAAEIGILSRIDDNLTVRALLGVAGDVSLMDQFGVQAHGEYRAYAEVSATIQRHVQLFVRAGAIGMANGLYGNSTEFQLLTGVTFVF